MKMEEPGMKKDADKALSDKADDMKSVSTSKSQNTNFTLNTINTVDNIPINQLHKNHYVYRRGSTKVHVQTYKAPSTYEVAEVDEEEKLKLNGLKLISAIFSMIIIIITFVIKVSAAMTKEVTMLAEDEYMLILYSLGFLWTFYYNFKGICFKRDEIQFSKSNKSSNQWLKGVVVLFGMAIVLNDGLAFIANLMVDTSSCEPTGINVATAVYFFHGLFIMSQVKYIFRFSKVFIRRCSVGSSTGVMFLISINLSIWIVSIVDETLKALSEESTEPDHPKLGTTVGYNTTGITQTPPHHGKLEKCPPCHTSFCDTVHIAETFLFPFGIEFALVSSCLLYVVWQNIGRRPPPCEGVIKPSYRFYKKYTGVAYGFVAIFVTIVFLILLGTSATDEEHKDFFTEQKQLLFYNVFLIAMETSMLIATLIGCFFFYRVRRPLEESSMLDQVLLGVCVVGPVTLSIFSLTAVIDGFIRDRVTPGTLSLVSPLVGVMQCTLQIVFIIYGLKREPVTSANSKEAAAHLRFGIHQHIKKSSQNAKEESDFAFDNKAYLKARRGSVTSVVSRLAHPKIIVEADVCQSQETSFDEAPVSQNNNNSCEVVISQAEDDISTQSGNSECEKGTDSIDSSGIKGYNKDDQNHSILKIVSETKVARPDQDRTRLRDVIIFLLITNACLWMFLSLSGTAYTIYQFESVFFGSSGWTIITMMCRPLNIFFRMHSAGCLFEMWSFA